MRNREKSDHMLQTAKKYIAGGVNSSVRLAERPFPMFFERGKGSRIYDVDGNEYIDYVLAYGPLILGHSPTPVIMAVKEQLDKGLMYAAQHELEIKVAEKLQRIVPCAELVRFNNTGSEAVHAALRLARAYTGRERIVKFEGHYHGWLDNELISVHPPLTKAGPLEAPFPTLESKGQTKSVLGDVIVLPWNNLDIFAQTIERHKDEIAAVITEPIMINQGGVFPREGYLEGLRDICTQHGVVLIFDEVITGFRFALGGAQEFFGVTPDLAVFAKAIAAGLPLSCVAGKKAIMDLITRAEVTHSGTYNSNPVVMAAAWATLTELEQNREPIYKRLFELGTRLADGIRAIMKLRGIPALVHGYGPSIHVAFTQREAFDDYRDTLDQDMAAYHRFVVALADRGVRSMPDGRWYLSAAHTEADIKATLKAVEEAVNETFS